MEYINKETGDIIYNHHNKIIKFPKIINDISTFEIRISKNISHEELINAGYTKVIQPPNSPTPFITDILWNGDIAYREEITDDHLVDRDI